MPPSDYPPSGNAWIDDPHEPTWMDQLFDTEGYLALCIGASLGLAMVGIAGMIVASYAVGQAVGR